MTVAEVREVRERMSLEICSMTGEEMREYYKKGATKAQQIIDEIRKQREDESGK
jgi:tripartite-type tricarboxylate transporter receptor subunit TctC